MPSSALPRRLSRGQHRPSEHAEVIVWPLSNPELKIEGVVREISPIADSATRTYTVKVTLKNPPPQLRFGMSIGGRWSATSGPVVALPLSALFEQERHARRMGRRPASGSVALRPVTVARYETDRVVIADGLAKGDVVVTAGVNTLREGQKVRACANLDERECQQMKNFNLSRWALEHKSLVVYLMLVVALAGLMQYGKLGREEDPPFTIKTMVVKTLWPGATTLEIVQQVTDRIEKKLEELPNLDYLKSYTKPGESVVFVTLKDAYACVRRAGSLVSGPQEGRRHQADLTAGRARSVLQRRVRRHLFSHLRPDRGRFLASRAARPCRALRGELLQRS